MNKRQPNPIDIHVGGRLRMRRMLVGMSQEKLGESLGLTFQQVQKYEKGTNRIGASRLYKISQILSVPVSFFFENIPNEEEQVGFSENSGDSFAYDFMNSAEGFQLGQAFSQIKDVRIRRRIIDLVRALSDNIDFSSKG
ncbi:MAG: helix-turn-helix transcriptional regulator [OCS116 cluster bacterium]|uniref:Transcriptional regulator n=1 Tax=OCS116 cluster bacterium TaxID=2030921 RepID=A0A2A4Z504_9PROT|nr:helix-turn-helix transcriptional regulator [OCS116 cluster bacterium]